MSTRTTTKAMKVALRAIELRQLIQKAQAELDTLKEALRADAQTTPWRELLTPLGSVRAAVVGSFMGPRKGKDGKLVSLEPALSMSCASFDLFFHSEQVVFLDCKSPGDFKAYLRRADAGERKIVRELIEEKPEQVRITLPASKS